MVILWVPCYLIWVIFIALEVHVMRARINLSAWGKLGCDLQPAHWLNIKLILVKFRHYQSILQLYWLKKRWVCTLIFTNWSSCFLEIAVDFWIVAHFQDQVDVIWILKIIVKLKNNKMVSVIVYNKIVTSFKATIILKISQLKVKFSIIVTCTAHYFRPRAGLSRFQVAGQIQQVGGESNG